MQNTFFNRVSEALSRFEPDGVDELRPSEGRIVTEIGNPTTAASKRPRILTLRLTERARRKRYQRLTMSYLGPNFLRRFSR